MTIGLIGTNWGRVHIHTLKQSGLDVQVILGQDYEKTCRIAQEEGIPIAARDVSELDGMDLIIIASPPHTHGEYLSRFKDKWILSEKPLGNTIWQDRFPDLRGQKKVFVNLAFSSLMTFQTLTRLIRHNSIGRIHKVELGLGVSFPVKKTAQEWFLDVGIHPYSWMFTLWKDLRYKDHSINVNSEVMDLEMITEDFPLNIQQYPLNQEGIKIEVTIHGETGELHTAGGYFPGRQWNFDPVSLNDHAMNAGEYSKDQDIWFRANAEYAGKVIDIMQGKAASDSIIDDNIYTLARAWDMESSLRPLFLK